MMMEPTGWKQPVAVRYFTVKKWILSVWLCVEVLEAIVFIVLAAQHYIDHSTSEQHNENEKRRDIVLAVILWTLVILVRLLFLYGILMERFWLCLSYTVISFGHIVIIATSGGPVPWISITMTALITIVAIFYLMDLYLLNQDHQERLLHIRQQVLINNNNNLNYDKINGTLV